MTEPSRRPTLVPAWLIATLVALGVLALAAAVFVPLLGDTDTVAVPSLEGLDRAVARSRLAQAGLLMTIGDTRFSSNVAAGGVLEQEPPAGAGAEPGSTISVILSAGADTFEMPDLVGTDVQIARVRLLERGVIVEIETIAADVAEGTVVSTLPAPGAEVRTGSTVKLTVAGAVGSDILLPGDLTGEIVLIDPEPPSGEETDIVMEVTRHLRALLEASGAEVLVTRSALETQAPVPARAAWAAEASATVAVGLGFGDVPGGTRLVRSLPASPDYVDTYLASVEFARSLASELAQAGEDVSLGLPVEDTVLVASSAPGARLLLGDPADAENVDLVSDPTWADTIARALYRAVVEHAQG
jgi:hypothetical protein